MEQAVFLSVDLSTGILLTDRNLSIKTLGAE